MRALALFSLIVIATTAIFAQDPTGDKPPEPAASPTATPTPTEQSEPSEEISDSEAAAALDSAIAQVTAADRSAALLDVLSRFPSFTRRPEAVEALLTARLAIAKERLNAGDAAGAKELYETAFSEMTVPVTDEIFNAKLVRLPGEIFLKREVGLAVQVARLLEEFASDSVSRSTALASFHLGIENGEDAARVARSIIEIAPEVADGYRLLGTAQRMNFDVKAAAESYEQALQLEPDSIDAKRSYADMLRASGRSREALPIYREILATDAADKGAITGLSLSLFETGDREAAEEALNQAIADDPRNVRLLASLAYWHAARGDGDAAFDMADQAIRIDPRFIWSHIAMARAHMLRGRPLEAEQVLVAARRYGNFPTLDLELAVARMNAGFYREAVETAAPTFEVADSVVSTRLGGRVARDAADLYELVAGERRASLMVADGAGEAAEAKRLAALMRLTKSLENEPDVEAAVVAADEFVSGSDASRLFRQLYAAEALLTKNVGHDKVLAISEAAMYNVDSGLASSVASSSVLASEIYDARKAAFLRNEFLVVPDLPRQTASAIVRGKIEEIAGEAAFQLGDHENAVVRLRRAISVLPVRSAWWRSAKWKLGDSLAAAGKQNEALEAYIDSYDKDRPDVAKYAFIAAMYERVNDSTDGLQDKIGPNPLPVETVALVSGNGSETPAEKADETPTTEPTPAENAEQGNTDVEAADEIKKTDAEKPKVDVRPEDEKPVEVVEAKDPEPVPEETAKEDVPAESKKPAESSESEASKDAVDPDDLDKDSAEESAKVDQKTEPKSPEKAQPRKVAELFESIVITVPSRSKPPAESEKQPAPSADAKEAENTATPEESKPDPTPEETQRSEAVEPEEPKRARPRVVDGKAIISDIPPCTIGLSQDRVSVINNGGSVGLIVSTDGDVSSIDARSDSPTDVEIRLEPQIAGIAGRAFYVVRSISERKGEYLVTLSAPCGRKDLLVTVR